MPQFAANISLMYTDLPFLDRFEAAARDGRDLCGFGSDREGREDEREHGGSWWCEIA